MISFLRVISVALAALIFSEAHAEDTVRIAVAANFKSTLEGLTAQYSQKRPTKFVITAGATGMLYAQIRAGAPLDLFFSADWERPDQLEREGATVEGTRFAYAIGRLALWTPGRPVTGDLDQTLRSANIRTIAIANPKTAPYGVAAQEVLKGSKQGSRFKVVQGENVGQTFQFAATGNADVAFIALAQLRDYERTNGKSLMAETLVVDTSLYGPIEQQAVLLKQGKDSAAARAFLEYVKSEPAQRLITAAGYRSLTWLPPGCHGCEKPKEAEKKLPAKPSAKTSR